MQLSTLVRSPLSPISIMHEYYADTVCHAQSAQDFFYCWHAECACTALLLLWFLWKYIFNVFFFRLIVSYSLDIVFRCYLFSNISTPLCLFSLVVPLVLISFKKICIDNLTWYSIDEVFIFLHSSAIMMLKSIKSYPIFLLLILPIIHSEYP